MKVKVSEFQYEKLRLDIKALEEERIIASAAKKEAADYGDLSENAEYDSAKKNLNLINAELASKKEIYENCEVIKMSVGDLITEGCLVRITRVECGAEIEIGLFMIGEDNFLDGFLDPNSPLGQQIIGGNTGTYNVQTPTGEVEVYKVERMQPDKMQEFLEIYNKKDFMGDISKWRPNRNS